MQEKIEKLITMVYRRWKRGQPKPQGHGLASYGQSQKPEIGHLDEETLVCFLENRLTGQENEEIKKHLIACDDCCELVRFSLEPIPAGLGLPQELLERVRGLNLQEDSAPVLEIFLRLGEKVLEIINTTGDVLLGQELVSTPILRGRGFKDFKDEVVILKDFNDIRLEVKIENKQGREFNLIISAKCKKTQKPIKDLRVSLIKDDLELESYFTPFGQASFEHVLLGKYKVQISTIESKLASVLLDIKV